MTTATAHQIAPCVGCHNEQSVSRALQELTRAVKPRQRARWITGVAASITAGVSVALLIGALKFWGDFRVMQKDVQTVAEDLKSRPRYDANQAKADRESQVTIDTAQNSAIDGITRSNERIADLLTNLDRRTTVFEAKLEDAIKRIDRFQQPP